MNKAVSTIVSAVIIVAITIGLTGTALIWGKPLIEKRQEATSVERAFTKFSQNNPSSLPKLIEDVANNRGTNTFTVDSNGVWLLNENKDYIEYNFTSKTSNIAVGTANPVSLTSGVQCTPAPSPKNGTLGQDSASVVCASARSEGGVVHISYRIYFREIYDNPLSPTPNGFKIDLIRDPTGLLASSGNTVRISFDSSTEQTVSGVNLITKKIKILLV